VERKELMLKRAGVMRGADVFVVLVALEPVIAMLLPVLSDVLLVLLPCLLGGDVLGCMLLDPALIRQWLALAISPPASATLAAPARALPRRRRARALPGLRSRP
jgi:hypothetical protein